MNHFVNAVMVLTMAVMLFGCTLGGGGNATPTPAPMATPTPPTNATPVITPQATPITTPVVTPTGIPAQTPTPASTPQTTPITTPTHAAAASPTPGVHVPSLSDIYGCSRIGLNYTYRMTTATTTAELQYATSEGGNVNGTDTVLKTAVASTPGMTVTMKEWNAKTDCRCIKAESHYLNNSIPVECPDTGIGTASANTTVTLVGEETVSVPAYSGPATRYAVVSTTSNSTYVMDVWTTPSIAVPVKMVGEGVTTELVRYHAG